MNNDSVKNHLNGDRIFGNDRTYFFTALDYGLFATMLIVSGLIGIYYGFLSKRKQNSTVEYILGNKEMRVIPVAASLIASHVSGTTMIALPADVYENGTQYAMCFICMIIVSLTLIYIYIPVFYDLGFTSCFTYLEKRFDRRARIAASLIYALACILAVPFVIYVPSLAFNQISGINVHYINIVICILCIFYTTIGGLRAVVWSDTIQFVSIIGAIVAIIYLGTASLGGVGNVFEAAVRGGRLILFDLNLSPFVKTSFWTVSIGMSTMWISLFSANQGTIQRCLSLPSKHHATICVWVLAVGVSVIKIASCYIGILLYATYENCDPLMTEKINKIDQILPYYTMELSKNVPGLPGIFIAGIFAAALSSMSSTLNSVTGTIYEDFIKPFRKNDDEKSSSNIMKLIVVVLGCFEVSLVFFVEKLGAILHISYSLHGLTSGTLLGIFTIGMISTKVNTKGIIVGSIASLSVVGTILIGAQLSARAPTLLLKADECLTNSSNFQNLTDIRMAKSAEYEEVFWLFRISFMYYALIGAFILTAVAYPVSLLTGGCGPVDESLLAPFRRKKLTSYNTVSSALAKTLSE